MNYRLIVKILITLKIKIMNKIQDLKKLNIRIKFKMCISGLFNENNDKRLSIEGEGNNLKLEGSKKGLCTVDKVVGDTFVNISPYYKGEFSAKADYDSYKQINTPNSKYINDVVGTLKQDIKSNTVYSLIYNVISVGDSGSYYINNPSTETIFNNWLAINSTTPLGLNVVALTTVADVSKCSIGLRMQNYTGRGLFSFEIVGLLEGDYTNKPIPSECIEGMQSTFEECKVTQEMVDSGEESVENLGKYKCLAKVRGINLLDFNSYPSKDFDPMYKAMVNNGTWDGITYKYDSTIPQITVNGTTTNGGTIMFGNIINKMTVGKSYRMKSVSMEVTKIDGTKGWHNLYTVTESDVSIRPYFQLSAGKTYTNEVWTLMLYEVNGDVVPETDPYYERTQTVYLNSPLLKGDEIVAKEDGLYHYHKMNKVVFDGSDDEAWGTEITYNSHYIAKHDMKRYPNNGYTNSAIISDKYATITDKILGANGIIGITGYGNIDAYPNQNWIYITGNADKSSFIEGLKTNPVNIVYELAEPYFDKISDDKLLLEIPHNATLSVESVIPCTSISASYTSSIPSLYGMENDITTLEETSVDIIATSWDTDFRVCEIEWTLEELVGSQQINLISERGVNTMALSRFEQAKIIILGDAYYRPTFEKQLTTYLTRGYLTQEEYEILISMMDARETIGL